MPLFTGYFLWIIGGSIDKDTKTILELDTDTGKPTQLHNVNLPTNRRYHAAACYYDMVVVAGGVGSLGEVYPIELLVKTAGNTFSKQSNIIESRIGGAAAAVGECDSFFITKLHDCVRAENIWP